MPGWDQDGLAAKPQLQASGAKRRRTENSAAAGSGAARLREKASACALAKLKAARQVAARPQLNPHCPRSFYRSACTSLLKLSRICSL